LFLSDYFNLFHRAGGSITETQSHIEYGRRVGYINEVDSKKLDTILQTIYKEINTIITTLKNKSQPLFSS